jgi:hypothetical protein
VLPEHCVLQQNMQELFNVNFNANLKLFLRLSSCASVGDKTLIIIKMHGMYLKKKIILSVGYTLDAIFYDSQTLTHVENEPHLSSESDVPNQK